MSRNNCDAKNISTEKSTASTSQQIEKKTGELLSKLTIDEKLQMMDGDAPFWPGMEKMLDGKYNEHPWTSGIIPGIGNPGIRCSDGPRGIVLQGATTFPVSIARGAAWDTVLEEKIGEAIGRELRAFGGNVFLGVCVNLLRHPAWGRAQETYGEDSHHLGEMGVALTRGVQKHAMACAKHFALNSIENARFKVDVKISRRALHEVYLPHFRQVVDEGISCIMSAYNRMNGEWCGQNKILLRKILKEKWGFKGFIVTDWFFGIRDAKKAVLAGQDLEMPFHMHYHSNLKQLVDKGEVPVELIDEAVSRLLREQLRYSDSDSGEYSRKLIASEEHRALALESAEKSIVLLQNKENLLPLTGVKKIAVIGKLADIPNTGDAGSSKTRPDYVITPLAGIKTAFKGKIKAVYNDGSDPEHAAKTAAGSDAVIIVAGYTHSDEGEFLDPETMKKMASFYPEPAPEEEYIARRLEQMKPEDSTGAFLPGGDRDSLTLSSEDETLIKTVSAANKKTIVAVMGGSAIIMESWREKVNSILMIWYPGMEGGKALANILLGKVNPGGKLPLVIPEKAEHLPFFDKNAEKIEYDLWHGYRKLEKENHKPAFPFGFGLSYTDFQYKNLLLCETVLSPSDTLQLQLELSNTGKFSGEEIVQVYISAINSCVERAVKELKAFTRVALVPGENKTVQFEIPLAKLAYYNESKEEFVVEAVKYEVFAGSHSMDPNALKACFSVQE
ncbi:MAG: glycoside hydrolase family 3 C-terminal domain-containing protein [Spirochaetes bacterium]|nr:glycoside hydrolase family 3 C-terminal domain-containing protein [Spirochaetota bacterium]